MSGTIRQLAKSPDDAIHDDDDHDDDDGGGGGNDDWLFNWTEVTR